MKKSTKFVLALLAFVTFGVTTFAQVRTTNMAVTLTSPANGSSLLPNVKVPITFSIKNMGPGNLVVGDTLVYQTAASASLGSIILQTAINNGQTSVITVDSIMNNGSGTADQTFSFCAMIFNPNTSGLTLGGAPFMVTYNDPDTSNNTSCNTVTIKKGTTGIGEFNSGSVDQLSFYPNPANGEITMNFTAENAEKVIVSVKDVIGREVFKKDFGTINAGSKTPLKLNIESLTEGMYLIELNAGGKRSVGKLTVRH